MDRKELRRIKESELTYELAHEDFTYDRTTGAFTRRDNGRAIAKPQAGEYNYCEVRWKRNGKLYQAHRLAWMMVHGKWPDGYIDHWNGNHGDNRLSNLRDCTMGQNLANQRLRKTSKTGIKGVYWDSTRGKWHAQLGYDGKPHSLGRFDTKEEAAAAYARKASEVYGEYARLA